MQSRHDEKGGDGMSISASSVTGDCTGLGLWLLVRGLSGAADAGLVLSLLWLLLDSGWFRGGTPSSARSADHVGAGYVVCHPRLFLSSPIQR